MDGGYLMERIKRMGLVPRLLLAMILGSLIGQGRLSA